MYAGQNESTYDLLSQIAPTLLWDIRTQLGQWQINIRALALALGDESQAEDAIAALSTVMIGGLYLTRRKCACCTFSIDNSKRMRANFSRLLGG
ncbi:MAG: hypothetical protein ACLFT0_13445 [Spirulinaceae cyanobacterium]